MTLATHHGLSTARLYQRDHAQHSASVIRRTRMLLKEALLCHERGNSRAADALVLLTGELLAGLQRKGML